MIFLAVGLTIFELTTYSRIRSNFPPGMVIAGVPVGGLDQQRASDRLMQAYTAVPVEVRYRDASIQIKPSVIGFELDIPGMMAAADQERIQQPFWVGFWDFLWNRIPKPDEVPLRSRFSEDRLRLYLTDEIAKRYDQPAEAAAPQVSAANFQAGKVGTVLDIDRAVTLMDAALRSSSDRVVDLSFNKVAPPSPPFQNLEILLQQKIEQSKFDGLIEVYVNNLQTGQEVSFAYNNLDRVPTDIAFTAASTMKIPIMVSIFRHTAQPLPENITQQMELMIVRSENDPADRMMETVLDKVTGPLQVTQDMQALGLKNTFLAGYFYQGAQLLKDIKTPANQRADVSAGPDRYNQTTAADMGQLLEDIYRCSENGGGTFKAVFPYDLTQTKCQQMINFLVQDKISSLLQEGVPEGTRMAHKHGWIIENDGLMHTIGDSALVYTPGGNYIITVYMYNKAQLVFEPANTLVAALSQATYSYFNLPGEQ